jgi:hypothetical protein
MNNRGREPGYAYRLEAGDAPGAAGQIREAKYAKLTLLFRL